MPRLKSGGSAILSMYLMREQVLDMLIEVCDLSFRSQENSPFRFFERE